MDDEEQLLKTLADADEARSLEKQVAELASTVADLSKRLAAREKASKIKVWNWRDATAEERATWIGELRTWLDEYLFVHFPWTKHPYKVPPCWANHPESVHALAALYQTWQKAYIEQGDPDLAAWWLSKWQELLLKRVYKPTTLCIGSVCSLKKQPRSREVEPEPEVELDEESVVSSRDHDGWGLG